MIRHEDLLRSMTADLREAAYVVDTDRCIHFWNKHAEQLTGYASADVVGRRCCDNLLIHVDAESVLCDRDCPMAATMAHGREHAADIYLRHKEGHRLPIHVSVIPLRDEHDRIIGALQTFHCRSQEMAALAAIEGPRRYMLICPMTGVANHTYTQTFLDQQIGQLSMSNQPAGVLAVRIDGYDRLAPSLGQSLCDVLVTIIARTLAADMRVRDFLGRWSESQFVAVLPNTDADQLAVIARRLAFLVSQSCHTSGRGDIRPAVTVGGCLTQEDDTPAEAIARAEKHTLAKGTQEESGATTGP